MPITLPKDSALYTAPPAKIGASSPMDMAGTDYGVQAFKPIVATSNASRINTANNSTKLDTKIAEKQTATETKTATDALAPAKLEPARDTASGGGASYGYKKVLDPKTGMMKEIPADADPAAYGFTDPTKIEKKTDETTVKDPYTTMLEDQQTKLDKDAAESKAFYDDFKIRQDATTAALIDSITKKYEARRAQMSDTNARMLEGKRIAGISAGRQRYAGKMEQGLLSTEEMDGQARLAQLDGEELQLIAQAKAARDESSMKAFNNYMAQLDKNNTDKMETITKLHQIAMDADKAIADKKKEEKAAVLDQTRMADSIAPAALQAYQGLKTPEEKSLFVQKLAEKYQLPPEMVQSSMLSYSDEDAKAGLERDMKSEQIKTEKAQQANYYSQIQDRKDNPSGTKKTNPLTQAETLLESGAKAEDGTVFNGRGADGFVDPYLYIQIYNGWDTEAEKVAFLKKFDPLENINPVFVEKYIEEIPKAIQVKLGI